jgi:hypothetical protein
MDGLVFVAIAVRRPAAVAVHELRCRRRDARFVRQQWVVERALELLAESLESKPQ